MNSTDSHENNQYHQAEHLERSETFNFLPSNKGFVFEEFVEGPSNKFAFETCKAIVDHLGASKHNPLMLYGASGIGKTHLIQAVGEAVLHKSPNTSVMYQTATQIISKFANVSQPQVDSQLSKCYKNVDLILIDDFELLAGKSSSLDDFFKVINGVLKESKQIIIASNLYPQEIIELDARLLSQLPIALFIEIEPPELENRVDILLRYSKLHHYELSRYCAICIAHQVYGNVRDLEYALDQVIAASRLQGDEISIEIIKETLKEQFTLRAKQISV